MAENDPGASFSTSHVGAVSVGGAPIGGVAFGPASTTRTLGADGDGHIRLPVFASSGDPTQRLSLGVYFDYLHADTDYYDGAPLGTHVGQDRFEGGGTLHYMGGSLYADAQIGAVGSTGRVTYTDASTGTFDSLGYKGQVVTGKIFTLYDARVLAPSQRGVPSRVIDGTDVTLDLAGRFTFDNETVGGFADTSGFQRGAEGLNEDGLGVRARLAADIYTNGAIVTPHVAVTLDQLVAFSHDLYIPTQASVATGGLESFSSPGRTLFGVNAGVSVLDTSGIRYGVEGYYSVAREINAGGGRIYVHLPVLRWLGLSG